MKNWLICERMLFSFLLLTIINIVVAGLLFLNFTNLRAQSARIGFQTSHAIYLLGRIISTIEENRPLLLQSVAATDRDEAQSIDDKMNTHRCQMDIRLRELRTIARPGEETPLINKVINSHVAFQATLPEIGRLTEDAKPQEATVACQLHALPALEVYKKSAEEALEFESKASQTIALAMVKEAARGRTILLVNGIVFIVITSVSCLIILYELKMIKPLIMEKILGKTETEKETSEARAPKSISQPLSDEVNYSKEGNVNRRVQPAEKA